MNIERKLMFLRIALIVIGLFFIFGLYTMMSLWPAGWRWVPNQTEYEQMIVVIYVVLGVFLIIASRDPLRHLSLICFTAWSSAVHGIIMAIQALVDKAEFGHLFGDVPALLIVAIVLALLYPKRFEIRC